MTFAFQDAAFLHIYNGNRHATYADIPAVVCAPKADEAEHQFVPPVLALTAVSVLQDFVIRNLLLVLLAAELFVTIVQAAGLAVAGVVTLTAVAAYHICIGCATLAMLDPVMCINL